MRKAQMEIMGVAVIVVLVTFGLLFAVKFFFLAPEECLSCIDKDSTMAHNTLISFLGTTTDCHDASVKALIEDCAIGGTLQCPQGSSCSYAKKISELVFNKTLDSWNRPFIFDVAGPGNVELLSTNHGCTPEMLKTSADVPVPTVSGTVKMQLRICRPR